MLLTSHEIHSQFHKSRFREVLFKAPLVSVLKSITGGGRETAVRATVRCVLYLHQLLCVLMQLLQYRQRLFRKAVFENALNDSAAIRVSGEGEDLKDKHNYTLLIYDLQTAVLERRAVRLNTALI